MATIRAHLAHQRGRVRRLVEDSFRFRSKLVSKHLLGYRPSSSFGLAGLDKLLIEAIDTSANYYVEIGANDGVQQSNTLALELFYGWNGLLIEPVDSTFQKLKKNRNGRRNHLLKAACVSEDFRSPSVDIIYSNLLSIGIGLDTDIDDPFEHADFGKRFLGPDDVVRVESVPAITMTRALELAKAPGKIGLLSLDVEGAELEVLKGVDFKKYYFDWIIVESRKVSRISEFLGKRGYVLLSQLSHHDYLFQGRLREPA